MTENCKFRDVKVNQQFKRHGMICQKVENGFIIIKHTKISKAITTHHKDEEKQVYTCDEQAPVRVAPAM